MKIEESTTAKQPARRRWASPWSYKESFIIAGALIVLGFIVELVFNDLRVPAPHRPYNLIIMAAGLILLTGLHIFYWKTTPVKWLSSVPCAVSAIVSFAVLVLLLGFIKQEDGGSSRWVQQLGLNQLKNAWPFLFIEVYLFVSLGMVILRRAYPLTRKNFGFLLNHVGLWITLMAVAMGAGDLQRLRVSMFENQEFTDKGVRTGHEIYNLPFSMKLLDFRMEVYNPKIMLSDTMGDMPEKQKGELLPMIVQGAEYTLGNFRIKILDILSASARTDSGYIQSNAPMAAAAARVHVKNLVTGDSVTNWICSGSAMMLPEYIRLEKNIGLWLLKPEPKKYESVVVVKTNYGKQDTVTIEVNRPYKTGGWSFYQIGYEEQLGPASKLSIIETVYDPWIKLVYTGIALMLAGAAYLFWLGRGVRQDV